MQQVQGDQCSLRAQARPMHLVQPLNILCQARSQAACQADDLGYG
jgi:hypothetical protein